jgi:hypothetical protein
MYELYTQEGESFPYAVLDENGMVVARACVEADGFEIVAALNLVEKAVEQFPGLVDGETSVSGSDLVELFNDTLEFSDGRFSLR